ncbi:universal stress protein [Isoptericola cucumis]|uniref:Universal stress protein n=1 Tax=Isoptericola cucumis TaxID=1776856 RepID=A0ABQ2B0R8_9MICO|nr:universal stress protein [Isoptericola cucumis]GGI05119.1 universal stress protein [Isoptericola cucumis]
MTHEVEQQPAAGWVVVAWTPDEFGQAALEHAVAAAGEKGRGVAVVNGTRGDAYVDERYAAPDRLADVTERLRATGLPHVVRQEMGRDVAEQVLDVAAELDARLVVVGLRHRSPVGKLLMGSVAQRILLTATCPVLAVKPGSQPA